MEGSICNGSIVWFIFLPMFFLLLKMSSVLGNVGDTGWKICSTIDLMQTLVKENKHFDFNEFEF